ncbi:hypothetical protein Bca4012_026272 [Brassica carinata]
MGGRNRKSLRSFVSSSSRAVQERERSEFRVLQAQVDLVPRQERLEFLYDSGLAVGKGSVSGSETEFGIDMFGIVRLVVYTRSFGQYGVTEEEAIQPISSSPPRKRLVKDFNVEIAPDFAQRAWMLKYPSAITSFGHIAAQAKDKKIAVFLDYDGTLVDV